MSDLDLYTRYFSVGMKIGVGIPMLNNELFRDWAIIHGIKNDLMELQLSRDVLPDEVDMQAGKVLELRCGKEGNGYRCRGVYISDEGSGNIKVRLSGELIPNELREYYRIDIFLPFKLQVSQEQNLNAVLKGWRTKKQNRLAGEIVRKEEQMLMRRDMLFKVADGEFEAEGPNPKKTSVRSPEDFDLIDHSWDDVMAVPVNLSAGGFKFVTSDHYEVDDLIYLEVFIPSNPPRIMDSVSRVVFKNRNYFAGNDEEYYNVAMQFLFIDERDRDAIVSHISNLELMRNRLLRQNYRPFDKGGVKQMIAPFRLIGATLLLLSLLAAIAFYFQYYLSSNVKSEIQETFEMGVRRYLEKFK